MAEGIRAKAKTYLDGISEVVTSNGTAIWVRGNPQFMDNPQLDGKGAGTAAEFAKLTGITQRHLDEVWKTKPTLTTCNEFVGHYTASLGLDYLGSFWVDDLVKKKGKGHAWIRANEDTRPNDGDIFLIRHDKVLHMGVSHFWNGDEWHTVESGQGGKGQGRDIILKQKRSYDKMNILGWVDIELYHDAATQTAPVPMWLQGWWKVTWRVDEYYYHFAHNHQVKYTRIEPVNTVEPPLVNVRDTGHFAVAGNATVTIRWNSTGSVEKFGLSPSTTEDLRMDGRWNDTEQISAVKM